MTRLEANRALCKELLKFFEENPHMRFEQTIENIVLNLDFYRESTSTLNIARIVLKRLSTEQTKKQRS